MDRHATLEPRFSLNSTAHMAQPIAESTCLNGSLVGGPVWLGKQLSPKQRSNSSFCLSQLNGMPNKSMTQNRSSSIYHTPGRSRQNLSRIDPRIYADVQSSGLASRVVKYNEQSRNLHRSMSVNNLYNKPGQFPVVHLKKKELPYRATTRTVSMTRIAPPERALFYGNTLSSLMRSNSIIGVHQTHKTDAELSCENRPILHPPPTESEPTRSVLEVLKEISRKRINSNNVSINFIDHDKCSHLANYSQEELQNDATKKSCNREYADYLDNTVSSLQFNGTSAANYKRQRELQQQASLAYGDACMSNLNQQKSPEQLAKRRQCSYNNDITSSLSSSLKQANKRKFFEQTIGGSHNSSTLNYTARSSPETYQQEAKIQRKQDDLHFEKISKSMSCHTPITPLPATPYSQPQVDGATAAQVAAKTSTSVDGAVLPQRNISAPLIPQTATDEAAANKPKLTLFNKNYDNAKPASPTYCVTNDNDDMTKAGECAGIPFVKPKKTLSSKANPIIERTQKSKLALMLSGLRGEIYHGEDPPDTDACDGKRVADKLQTPLKPTAAVIAMTTKSPLTTSTITSSQSTVSTLAATASVFTLSNINIATTTTATALAFSLTKVTNATTALTTATTTSTVESTNTKITFGTPSTQTPNLFQGFGSLAASKTITTTMPTSAITTPAAITTASLLTTPAVAVTTSITTTAATATSAPPLSFNFKGAQQSTAPLAFGMTNAIQTTTAAATATTSISPATEPAKGSNLYAFGSAKVATTTTAVNLNVSNSSTFTFGGATTTVSSPPSSSSTTLSSTTAAPIFGSLAAGTLTKPTFNFGSSAQAATAATAANTVKATTATASSTTQAVTSGATASNPVFGATTTLNFGNANNNAASASVFDAFKLSNETTNMNPTFKFGAGDNSTAGISTTTTQSSTAVTAITCVAPTTTFTFGGTTNGTMQSSTTGAAPPSFAAVASNPATKVFGKAVASTTAVASNTATFGSVAFGGKSTVPAAQQFPFGGASSVAATTTNANSSIFAFGGASATTNNGAAASTTNAGSTAATQASAATTTNLFSFGQKANAPATTPFAFGGASSNISTNNAQPAAPFSFGAANTNNEDKPATTNAFSFNASSAPQQQQQQQQIVQPAAAPSNVFTFGGVTTNATNQASQQQPASNSIFASTMSATTTANPVASNSPFSFGATAAQKPSVFGSAGDTTNNTIGSAAATPFSFGGASANTQNKSAAGGFSFGASANTPSTSNVFGSVAATQAPAATPNTHNTGIVKPSFSFCSTETPYTLNSAGNVGASTFGGLSAASQQQHQQNNFAFGGTTANGGAAAQTAASNLFGSAIAAATANNTKPSPAVGGFSFGTAKPAAASNSAPFAFGGIAAGAAPTANNTKPFAFGATAMPGTSNSTNATNLFGASTAPSNNGPFSFTGSSNMPVTPSNTQNPNSGNIFALPGDRPIRRATRRLHPPK